eukprot:2574433-Rhodomonas_salina.1
MSGTGLGCLLLSPYALQCDVRCWPKSILCYNCSVRCPVHRSEMLSPYARAMGCPVLAWRTSDLPGTDVVFGAAPVRHKDPDVRRHSESAIRKGTALAQRSARPDRVTVKGGGPPIVLRAPYTVSSTNINHSALPAQCPVLTSSVLLLPGSENPMDLYTYDVAENTDHVPASVERARCPLSATPVLVLTVHFRTSGPRISGTTCHPARTSSSELHTETSVALLFSFFSSFFSQQSCTTQPTTTGGKLAVPGRTPVLNPYCRKAEYWLRTGAGAVSLRPVTTHVTMHVTTAAWSRGTSRKQMLSAACAVQSVRDRGRAAFSPRCLARASECSHSRFHGGAAGFWRSFHVGGGADICDGVWLVARGWPKCGDPRVYALQLRFHEWGGAGLRHSAPAVLTQLVAFRCPGGRGTGA